MIRAPLSVYLVTWVINLILIKTEITLKELDYEYDLS